MVSHANTRFLMRGHEDHALRARSRWKEGRKKGAKRDEETSEKRLKNWSGGTRTAAGAFVQLGIEFSCARGWNHTIILSIQILITPSASLLVHRVWVCVVCVFVWVSSSVENSGGSCKKGVTPPPYSACSALMISEMPSYISLTAWNSVSPMRRLLEMS